MPSYLVQQTLRTVGGMPEDFVVNTWSIDATDLAALEVAIGSIHDFYVAIQNYLSESVLATGHPVKAYDRADPEPRAPVFEDTFDFTGGLTSETLPHECAICLSFQADVVSGLNQARRRGRVYLGPLGTNTRATEGTVGSLVQDTIVTAANDLLTASNAATAWDWVVWSGVNGTSAAVSNGWVDNAYDTQRRRGRAPTVRDTFPA